VVHINSAGPKVKVELITEWRDPVFAEIDHDRFDALKLEKGQRVYARPKEKTAGLRLIRSESEAEQKPCSRVDPENCDLSDLGALVFA